MAKARESKKQQEPNELTADELKKFEGLETLTDVEADNIAASLKLLSLITYQLFETQNIIQDG